MDDEVGEPDRTTAIARLHDLFSSGAVSLEHFYRVLEGIFAAHLRTALEEVLSSLPPPVRLTPTSLRLSEPLVLRVADGGSRLGAGWQLASNTTVIAGSGATLLDLCAATWDALAIDLHLETWGSINVIVPRGVAVQMVGGSRQVRLDALSPAIPGGPLLRIRTSGPSGVISVVNHLDERSR